MNNYSINKLRNDFPILKEKVYGKNLVYLDSASSAQKPQIVIDTMQDCLQHNYSNVHRGMYYFSNKTTEDYENARHNVQNFINAFSQNEIIFTKNATEAINLVAYSWGLKNLKANDEIILSIAEHHANIVPWHILREKIGVKLKFISLAENGAFDLKKYKKAFNKNTKLVAITHMSNITGELMPAKQLVDYAHDNNVPILLDGSQAIIHNKLDVQNLNCDWYVFTGHKLYGPTGIGVLYGKYDILKDMPPFLGGGNMINDVTLDEVSYQLPPFKFEAGTPPIVEAIGLNNAINYLNHIDYEELVEHEMKLFEYAKEGLEQIKDLTLYGCVENSKSIFSFNLKNIHPHDLATYLDRKAIAIRAGTHCAQPLLNFFKINACARASIALYNNKIDIEYFIAELEKAQRFFNA